MEVNEFLEPFERMLTALFEPGTIRAIEHGGDWKEQWQEIEGSGFLDALVPEAKGGAGLSLAEAGPLLMALGKYAVPLPVGETMLARALLANSGHEAPVGAIALATRSLLVPNGLATSWILGSSGAELWLCKADEAGMKASGAYGSLDARMEGPPPQSHAVAASGGEGLELGAALLRSASMAGAAQRALEMSVTYANERIQFGKPIGRQQAIQQQLAVMAEQVAAMRMSVELACAASDAPSLHTVAAAKSLTSEYATLTANCAHAVHGAIGISEEFDLQLYTRRLLAWSRVDGGSQYWNSRIGAAAIGSSDDAIDWVRGNLFA